MAFPNDSEERANMQQLPKRLQGKYRFDSSTTIPGGFAETVHGDQVTNKTLIVNGGVIGTVNTGSGSVKPKAKSTPRYITTARGVRYPTLEYVTELVKRRDEIYEVEKNPALASLGTKLRTELAMDVMATCAVDDDSFELYYQPETITTALLFTDHKNGGPMNAEQTFKTVKSVVTSYIILELIGIGLDQESLETKGSLQELQEDAQRLSAYFWQLRKKWGVDDGNTSIS